MGQIQPFHQNINVATTSLFFFSKRKEAAPSNVHVADDYLAIESSATSIINLQQCIVVNLKIKVLPFPLTS